LQWKESAGDESKEYLNYTRRREQQEKAEQEMFTRAPVTKREKYMEKQMKQQLNEYAIHNSIEFMELILIRSLHFIK
jgi:hypothetical protein